MKRREAERIVVEAAGEWLNELEQYVIPEAKYGDEEGYRDRAKEIQDALNIVTGKLDAEDFHKKDAGDFGRCPF